MKKERGSFETETLHRMLIEAVRYWVIEWFLRTKKLPAKEIRYVYSGGTVGIGWGSATGLDDPNTLRGKRIKVTIEIED
jgi:hypothetical protein